MLEFVKGSFRGLVEIVLWLILIGYVIVGFSIGKNDIFAYSVGDEGFAIILGIIVGLVVGIITVILLGGYISTILSIDKHLEKLEENSEDNGLKLNLLNEKLSKKEDTTVSQSVKNVKSENENLSKKEKVSVSQSVKNAESEDDWNKKVQNLI